MECPNIQGCEKIIIQVNTTITDNTSLECGEFDVSVSFNVLQGADCISDPDEDIYRVRWYIGPDFLNYNPRRVTSIHFSRAGSNTLKLQFAIRTSCDVFHKEVFYTVSNPEECSGCYGAVSYCDLYCNPLPVYNDSCDYRYYLSPPMDDLLREQIPEIYELKFFSLSIPHVIAIGTNQNYGIFNFPYYARDEEDCPNVLPGLYELVEDLNRFLDLSRSGQDEYANYYGHVYLMDSYGDITEAGDTDLCKIRINFVDMGIFFQGFHRIEHYEFDLLECKIGNDLLGIEDEHIDPRFGYSDSCTIPFGYLINNNYNINDIFSNTANNYFITQSGKEDLGSLSVECYPTIVNNELNLQWVSGYDDNVLIEIFDTNGKIIKRIDNIKRANSIKVNTQDFKKGIYFLKIINKTSGFSDIKKVVKQ